MKFKLFVMSLMSSMFFSNAQITPLYIGTYTNGESEGIYELQFNTKTGELSNLRLAVTTENPSFIAYSPQKQYLYAVNENVGGSVSAFKVEQTGLLQFLNQVKSNGGAPCHVSVNKAGDKAVVSNYTGGSISIYNIYWRFVCSNKR